MIAHKLGVDGLKAAYEYSNEVLGLSENIDVLVSDGEEHIRLCS
jgi:hypothetical protein